MRIFCAVDLPDDVRAQAAAHISRLREAASTAGSPHKIGWERAEKLHLTLKFLGELEPVRIEALTRAAKRAAESVERFTVTLAEAGAFPPNANPRVLWLGFRDETKHLAALYERLEEECARENFPREARAFHPHITLARIRIPNAAPARHLAKLHRETNFEPASFDVHELIVMQSQLGTGGSRYTPLSKHELKAEAGS
ncbi:MAG TPA: RNA 2',3'-cyclic phosphodiesterase [Pyrinomonadaceae bacterium]|jgi:2'-5' RNA ligase|nr:RNA 2',3'-cyclic phosphodiesterase [Pyrinomonadaceae bacterium]